MATWGDFLKDVSVVRMSNGMYVKVDDVITLWEELNNLRTEVAQLREAVTTEREACAREVEEFAEACAAEADTPEVATAYLKAAASIIRDKDEVPEAEIIEGEPPPEPEQAE